MACLQGIHAVLAHLGGPHWLLNDGDAQTYARAVQNVARHYDVGAAQKTIDIANLVGMVAFIEGTRVLAQRQAKKAPPPQAQQFPAMSAFQFVPQAPQPAPGAVSPAPEAEGPLH